MDFGCRYDGYCSDMTRTVVLGEASSKQKEIYGIVLKAQMAALEQICAGKTGSEVDQVARGLIAEAGYGEYFGHGLGHSVGLFIHEETETVTKMPQCIAEKYDDDSRTGHLYPGIWRCQDRRSGRDHRKGVPKSCTFTKRTDRTVKNS